MEIRAIAPSDKESSSRYLSYPSCSFGLLLTRSLSCSVKRAGETTGGETAEGNCRTPSLLLLGISGVGSGFDSLRCDSEATTRSFGVTEARGDVRCGPGSEPRGAGTRGNGAVRAVAGTGTGAGEEVLAFVKLLSGTGDEVSCGSLCWVWV
jgi:hypothetical protein